MGNDQVIPRPPWPVISFSDSIVLAENDKPVLKIIIEVEGSYCYITRINLIKMKFYRVGMFMGHIKNSRIFDFRDGILYHTTSVVNVEKYHSFSDKYQCVVKGQIYTDQNMILQLVEFLNKIISKYNSMVEKSHPDFIISLIDNLDDNLSEKNKIVAFSDGDMINKNDTLNIN